MNQSLDVLLSEAANLAIAFIEKSGEFYPFAVVVSKSGKSKHLQGWSMERVASSDAILLQLKDAIRNDIRTGDCVAVAIVSSVRLFDRETSETFDTIQVEMEELNGQPVTCFIPFAVDNKRVETKDVRAVPGEHRMFGEYIENAGK